MPNAARFPDKRISAGAAKAQLVMMLCNCPDGLLASFTAESLARQYRVKPAEIAEMLAAERGQRGI